MKYLLLAGLLAGASIVAGSNLVTGMKGISRARKTAAESAPLKVTLASRQPGAAQIRGLFLPTDTAVDLTPQSERPEGLTIYQLADVPLILTEPAAMEIAGRFFSVNANGLYRFFDLQNHETRHVILHQKNDVWCFAASLSRLQLHGWRHNQETTEALDARARKGRISITCERMAHFTCRHLNAHQIKARIVFVRTLDQTNGYDDGHVITEILDPASNRWILYDPDAGCRFKHDGKLINLAETIRLYRDGVGPEIDVLRSPSIDSYTEAEAPADLAQYSILGDSTFRDARTQQKWYRRMFQLPVRDGHAVVNSDAEWERARTLYPDVTKCMSWNEWMRDMYGDTLRQN